MKKFIKLRTSLKADSNSYIEYKNCISELIENEIVLSMDNFIQHKDITCLEHCIYVSYTSFKVCKYLGFDYRSAARGGLLHDLFLYDWHIKREAKGLHGFTHPYTALENANKNFDLNELEKDIIVKHMWPLTRKMPGCKEAYIVTLVDKYCATAEIIKLDLKSRVNKLKRDIIE